jgi:hypothetical protein
MGRTSERGEGKLGTIIFFGLLVAIGMAAWNVIPVYYEHYDFTDVVEEVCRTPVYKARTPEIIKGMLMKEVQERRLGQWIGPENFQITKNARSRQITLRYERKAKVLPGWERVFRFEYTADQPLI